MDQSYVNVGVAVLVAAVFGIIGMQVATEADFDTVYTVDNDSEWNAGTLNGLQVSNGALLLNDTATTGDYTSETISNSTDRVEVYASVDDPDNSSVSLTVGGTTYELNDGRNAFNLDSTLSSYTFTLDYSRDATSVTSPEVSLYEAQSGEGGLLTLIATAAFALLLLMSVLRLRHSLQRNGM